MRQPRVTPTKSLPDESGGKYYYIESDFVLTNLLPSLHNDYGKKPHVFYRYESAGGNPDYFQRPQSYMLYINKNSTNSSILILNPVGGENSISQLCADSVRTLSKPKLERAGVVSMAFTTGVRGTGTLEGSALYVGEKGYDYNASNIEILNAWNSYVKAKESGISGAALESRTLRYLDKFGTYKIIDSFRDLQEAFPKWFLINNEMLSESLLNIVGDKISQFNGQMYPASYVGLWQKYSQEGLSEQAIVQKLQKNGYTQSQINATRLASGLPAYDLRVLRYGDLSAFSSEVLKLAPLSTQNNPNNPVGGGSGGASGGGGVSGGARNANGSPWFGPEGYKPGTIQQITVGRSRNIFLTSEQIQSIVSYDNQQQVMYQVYVGSSDTNGQMNPILTQYNFDFAPNEINYSNFGGEWMSIERSGSFPIIDWKNFKLLQISFSFIIANKNGELTADGLELPVTEQIETLQRMAQAPYPVMFYGFDTLLTNQFRYDTSGKPRGIQFVIQDLSISSQRRNKNMEITRAQATITLQEIPVETTSIIGMPRLRHKPEVPKTPTTTTDPEYGLFTDSLTVQGTDTLTYRT